LHGCASQSPVARNLCADQHRRHIKSSMHACQTQQFHSCPCLPPPPLPPQHRALWGASSYDGAGGDDALRKPRSAGGILR
jgi:hypothetical protein